jgi:hypothetical protein
MKLKPIEDEMVVHCKTEDEAKELIKWACDERGYNTFPLGTWHDYKDYTCYHFYQLNNGKNTISYCNKSYYLDNNYEITEFSDLIIPEEEMREAAKEEKHAVNDYIDSISKQTNTDFYDKEHMSGLLMLIVLMRKGKRGMRFLGMVLTYITCSTTIPLKKSSPKSNLTNLKRNREKK